MKRLFCIVFILASLSTFSQTKTRILFILDASNSMNLKWENQTRMESAKEILNEAVENLRGIPDLEIALRVYGHQSLVSNTFQDCNDTKLEVPFGPNTIDAIKKKVKFISAKGATPIARSLEAAAGDFPSRDSRNFIILITDGLESCDNDPCVIAKKLKEKEVNVTPFVIGIGLDLSYLEQFNCIGSFTEAENKLAFKSVLTNIIDKALLNTTVQVNLNDLSLQPKETNVSMLFYRAGTDEILYSYTHTLNQYKNPDTLVLNPGIKYDLKVETLPSILKQGISIKKHTHNTIHVDAAQGFLKFTSNRSAYNIKYPSRIIKEEFSNTINHQELGSTQKYLIGKYEMEVFTLPRTYKKFEINEYKTTTIDIAASGTLDLKNPKLYVGQVFVKRDNESYEWVCNLNAELRTQKWQLQPGNYKIIYREKEQFSTAYTNEKTFSIKSLNTNYLKL
ncbi:MAG: VWA domain-containing protein [Crocinitomicaceae bacterium]